MSTSALVPRLALAVGGAVGFAAGMLLGAGPVGATLAGLVGAVVAPIPAYLLGAAVSARSGGAGAFIATAMVTAGGVAWGGAAGVAYAVRTVRALDAVESALATVILGVVAASAVFAAQVLTQELVVRPHLGNKRLRELARFAQRNPEGAILLCEDTMDADWAQPNVVEAAGLLRVRLEAQLGRPGAAREALADLERRQFRRAEAMRPRIAATLEAAGLHLDALETWVRIRPRGAAWTSTLLRLGARLLGTPEARRGAEVIRDALEGAVGPDRPSPEDEARIGQLVARLTAIPLTGSEQDC